MSDRQSASGLNPDLGAALRALPLAAPAPGAWNELAASLRRAGVVAAPAPRRWRYVVPAALAAALAFALLLPRVLAPPPALPDTPLAGTHAAPHTPPATAAADSADIDALRAQSQQLEHWLRQVADAGAPLPGQDLMAATEIEDLIGLVDVQLAGVGDQPESAALWRQRIALLQDLGAIRTTAYSLAGNDGAAYGNATPSRSWIN